MTPETDTQCEKTKKRTCKNEKNANMGEKKDNVYRADDLEDRETQEDGHGERWERWRTGVLKL